ncbi:MAG TPA: hypothetical protein PKW33_07815 [Anaerolineaceae bacterium]|nr:hypothetical protein [Anaerolineaceae bacterium]HPN51479.1 hypothetical protein [Anaerolineaceae bacterium]
MNTNQLIQAYRQAPWRTQLQWIGIFLLILVLIASVLGLFLDITARTSTAGRNIQLMEDEILQYEQNIASLTARLAEINSSANMRKRAEKLNFVPVDPNEVHFMIIPDAQPRQSTLDEAPAFQPTEEPVLLQPEYTLSLWDWFSQTLTSLQNQQVTP